ncbi:MAG TPA: hypothetical protein VFH54_13675 [Mycobacteriales bacterium]|nr:hypothetical protein [Mycobacteriales bacterium]
MDEFEARRSAYLERILQLAQGLPVDAVISDEAAAVVRRWPVYRLPAPVMVTRTRGRAMRTSDVYVRIAGLRPWDRTVVDGIPCTSAARTVVDLGRRLPFREALVVADAALRSGVERNGISDVLRHQYNWPGIFPAKAVVRHADARSESALESVVRSRFLELRLPTPELQVNIYNGPSWIARVDFDLKAYNTVGEADGRGKYLQSDDELWAEKQRQDAIEETGREVIRWNWRTAHAPDRVFAERVWRKLRRGLYLRGFDPST